MQRSSIEKISKLLAKPKGMEMSDIEISCEEWVYRPITATFEKWAKSKFHVAEEFSLSAKVRGQGHSHYDFAPEAEVTVEVTDIKSSIQVVWQNTVRRNTGLNNKKNNKINLIMITSQVKLSFLLINLLILRVT